MELGLTTALQLQHILALTPINKTKANQADPGPYLKELCQLAYDFAVLIRRSPNNLKIEIPNFETAILESEHNVVAQEGPRTWVHSGVVKCPISGALVSYVAMTGDRVLHQKADVTVWPLVW